MSSKNIRVVLACVILLIAGLALLSRNMQQKSAVRTGVNSTVTLGPKVFHVEVADTPALQERGLSGHAPLADNQGMIFIFDKPDNYGFWMKDMLFPLDIIWIGPDWRVTHIEKSLATSTYPQIFYPGAPSLYVLEISSGQSDMLGLKVGDAVRFSAQ
jgi:uncharacterized protein